MNAYKQSPGKKMKTELELRFDTIFAMQTSHAPLDEALRRIYKNKAELLL